MTEQNKQLESSSEKVYKSPRRAYMFDVDGVLTDPESIQIKQSAIIDGIVKRLKQGCPIGFNTGLSLDNMDEMVLRHI